MEAIRKFLLNCCRKIKPQELFPTLVHEATNLITHDPFAFLLAVSLDRGTKAEIIWTIPFWIKTSIGHIDPCLIAGMNIDQIKRLVEGLPRKPRYINYAPRTIYAVSRLVCQSFGGDAATVWKNKTAAEVKRTLLEIPGIGEGIASMALILLERCRGVRFPDWSVMDVKPDVHVQRVLFRLGIATALDSKAAIAAARELNPEYPGALDPPLWIIGRQWCKVRNPDCSSCWITTVCPKIGVAE